MVTTSNDVNLPKRIKRTWTLDTAGKTRWVEEMDAQPN